MELSSVQSCRLQQRGARFPIELSCAILDRATRILTTRVGIAFLHARTNARHSYELNRKKHQLKLRPVVHFFCVCVCLCCNRDSQLAAKKTTVDFIYANVGNRYRLQ